MGIGEFAMTARLALALTLAVALAGCGAIRDSRLNPLNWFGRSAPVERVAVDTESTADPRPLVETVTDMKVDAFRGGAIVRATGLTPTQGWWAADLVELPIDEDGVLVLEFRLLPPLIPADVNTPQSRTVTVGLSLSDIKLAKISRIVVQGKTNARASAR
jgi:hypothetical protein